MSFLLVLAASVSASASGSLPMARAAAKARRRNEPFDSFRRLDSRLSALNQQLEELKKAVDQHDTGKHGRKAAPWLPVLHRMRPNVAAIQQVTERLQFRYRRSRFGRRSFTRLHTDATNVRRRLRQAARAQTPQAAKSRVEAVSHALLAFVLAFQHVSGGYGGLRCHPREWACCQPKPELGAATASECAWECVATPERCTGFRGPRTPAR